MVYVWFPDDMKHLEKDIEEIRILESRIVNIKLKNGDSRIYMYDHKASVVKESE